MKFKSLFIQIIIFIPFLALSFQSGLSQTLLKGTIRDAKKKTPLSYCGVSVKGTHKSCIANEDGVFQIIANTDKDSLIFAFLGYTSKTLAASEILRNNRISLESSEIVIEEFVIHADDDYLYDIFRQAVRKIKNSPSINSKLYFNVQTEYQKQFVEMLECYYNCTLTGSTIADLHLKNGRIGLALADDSSFFVSLNTSKAISYINLSESNEYLPSIPFQFSKSKMRKNFALKIFPRREDDEHAYHLGFTPKKNDGSCFSGEVWIDKKTYNIIKLILNGENLNIHPFLPLFSGTAIDSVSMNISLTYNTTEDYARMSSLVFKYNFVFRIGLLSKKVNTKGVMYFYDTGDPFILPYFDYDENQSDYRKITFLPYNASFWNNSNGLINTEEQLSIIDFLHQNGVLLNYYHSKFNIIPKRNYLKLKGNFFEDNLVYWSDTSRLSLKKNQIAKDSLQNLSVNSQQVKADLYHFRVQIFLDINPVGDTLQWLSATVFDVFKSFYKLPEEKYSNCFLNIYFDICEIERRKMEARLREIPRPDKAKIDAIYNQTLKDIDVQTALYLKKVQSGKNYSELVKWNNYVKKTLGVDNIKIFDVKDENALVPPEHSSP